MRTLQGSLNDFALEEILGLLAETSKSGQLDISGDRGSGMLAFSGGMLAKATASNCATGSTPEEVMFELLRFSEGSFVFSNREVAGSGDEQSVSGVLSVAENRLADWMAIAEVVPSLQHIVTPNPELPEDEISIDRSEWAALVAIAAGCPVAVLCDELELGEVEGCRKIKRLIERGLVTLDPPFASSSKNGTSTGLDAISPPSSIEAPSLASAMSSAPLMAEAGSDLVSHTPPPAAKTAVNPTNGHRNGEETVASLRVSGGVVSATAEAPPSLRPEELQPGLSAATLQTGEVPALAPNGQDGEDSDGEGLLMRYLKGDDS